MMKTLTDLFAEDDAARVAVCRAERAAEDNDPQHAARMRAKFAALEEKMDREIAAGLRDTDGEWIETDEPEDDEEEGEDEGVESDPDPAGTVGGAGGGDLR